MPPRPPKKKVPALTKPFTQAELQHRQGRRFLNSFLFRYDTRDKILGRTREARVLRLPGRLSSDLYAPPSKVTLADVKAAAKNYIPS